MDLQYYKTFSEDTSQGIVGLLKPVHHNKNKARAKIFRLENEPKRFLTALDYFFVKDAPTYPIYVFKLSKEVNTFIDHEYKISKDLEDLCLYLPHFNRILEVKKNVKCCIPSKVKPNFNPFNKYNCIRDVALVEYIPSTLTLLEYLQGTNFSGAMDSLIHQLILALFIAQQEKKFTHYDLHLENVLLRKCLKRTFFWYKFTYESVVINRLVYTDGYFPVLFDYGFSYSKGLEGTSFTNSLFFTNKGYTSFIFDDINDFKTLLIRLAYFRGCPSKFKNLANTHFLNKHNIDRETGWNHTTISSMARIICKKLEHVISDLLPDPDDHFIYRQLDNVIDLFGILLKLPLGLNTFKTETLKDAVNTLLIEWEKIDGWFSGHASDDKLNILKRIFETINELVLDEEEDPSTCDDRNHKFKLKIFEIFDAFGDFVYVENVNYGQLLSSIIQISNFIEHVVYNELQRYKKLFNFNIDGWDLFTAIEDVVQPTTPYKFKLDDHIVLFDCVEKVTSSFELKDVNIIEALNLSSDIKVQVDLLNNLQTREFSEKQMEN